MLKLSLSLIIVTIAVILGLLVRQQQTPPPFWTQPCTDNSTLEFSGSSIDPCRVFSETYVGAREKFRQAATKIGAELHRLDIPVPPEKALDQSYTIDLAILKGVGPGLVVHTSGVHGVEGYAGSAIQIAFLEGVYSGRTESAPTIVLVHAVNPYGMAHYRRTNENNVDLNRNGLHPDEWKGIHTEGPTGIYESYGKFQHLFNPKGAPNWLYALVSWWLQTGQGLAVHGFDALKAAMVTGQYYDETGIFFGGRELQPSLGRLWDFLQTSLLSERTDEGRPESTRCCTGIVTWIDVHTGLGPSGVDSILFDGDNIKQVEEVEKWFAGAQIPQSSGSAKEVNKGYDKVKGFTSLLFRRLWAEEGNHQYLALTQEFGTVPGPLVAHALILENRAFHHLPTEQALEWARRTTKRAFYKQTPRWRRQILERGLQLLQQAIQRSSSSSP